MSSSSWARGSRRLGFPPAVSSIPPLPKAQRMLSPLRHPPGRTPGLGCFPCEVWEWSQLPAGGFWEDRAGGCARVALAERSIVVGTVVPARRLGC